MRQEDELSILHEICRNSRMGIEAINQVLGKVYDEEFAYELHVEAEKLQEFEQKARQRLQTNGTDAAGSKPAAKAMLNMAIQMKTMFSERKDRVADLIQKGNKRGAEELKNAIHKYKGAGIYATELAREMIDFEEASLKKLSAYKND